MVILRDVPKIIVHEVWVGIRMTPVGMTYFPTWMVDLMEQYRYTGKCIYNCHGSFWLGIDLPIVHERLLEMVWCSPYLVGTKNLRKPIVLAVVWSILWVSLCWVLVLAYPSLPNTSWVDVWTPKHLLRRPFGVPNTSSKGIWRILED